MRKIFFTNTWTEMMSAQYWELLEKNGYTIQGNWLTGKRYFENIPFDTSLIVHAPCQSGVGFHMDQRVVNRIPTIFLATFPDCLIGWDFEKNEYKFDALKRLEFLTEHCVDFITVSNYAAKLMNQVYKKSFSVIYDGLPIQDMLKIKRKRGSTLTVLWNHMWRTDKGFLDALKIIRSLSGRFPRIQFNIGRMEDWGDEKYSPPEIKLQYRKFLSEKRENIKIFKRFNIGDKKNQQKAYWSFLKNADIGFSTSFHEAFGVGMLEQAVLGLACVVPDCEAYPELYPVCCLSEPSKDGIQEKLIELINDKGKRFSCSRQSTIKSRRFTIERAANQYIAIFNKHI